MQAVRGQSDQGFDGGNGAGVCVRLGLRAGDQDGVRVLADHLCYAAFAWRVVRWIRDRPPGPAQVDPAAALGNNDSMPSWREIEQDAPDFTFRVRRCFEAGTNKTLATLRRDGAPRINASEIEFSSGGEVTLGMMSGSMKLLDVLGDPRVALHSPTLEPPKDDPNSGPGDAKMSGSLVEIRPPVDNPHTEAVFFKLDITELVLTYVGTPADHLVIESWHPVRGWERRTRT
jgi:hypothetical protein